MSEIEELLKEIEKLLKELIVNATELKKTSEHVITKKELTPLQKKEKILIKQLTLADKKLSKEFDEEVKYSHSKQLEQIDRMLQEFQQLNQEFFQNIDSQESIIHFHLSKKQQDLLKE